jgi:hypothetical protein
MILLTATRVSNFNRNQILNLLFAEKLRTTRTLTPLLKGNSNVHYRVHKILPLDTILGQQNTALFPVTLRSLIRCKASEFRQTDGHVPIMTKAHKLILVAK